MKFEYSVHWEKKKKYRNDITDDMFEYVISNSNELRDKYWENASNAIVRMPPSGRLLKVVYRKVGRGSCRIITAYWLD